MIGYDNDGEFVANKVLVNDTVTKEMMDALTEVTLPTLTFTAYAIQQANIDTAAAAWTALND